MLVGLAASVIEPNQLKNGSVRSANLANNGFNAVVKQSPTTAGKADRLYLPRTSVISSPKAKTQYKKSNQATGSSRARSYSKLFETLTFRTNGFSQLKTWQRAMAKIKDERPLYRMCERQGLNCSPLARQWLNLLKMLRPFKGKKLVQELNFAVNVLGKYRKDMVAYNQPDHWASPFEFFQSGGDCEDFVIAKYVGLLELGVAADEMRIVVVHDKKLNIGHAVLLVSIDGERHVLDNRSHTLLNPLGPSQYRPLYSVNRNTRWIHVETRRTMIRG